MNNNFQMKPILLFLFVVLTSFISLSQYPVPEILESDKKTQFRYSFFQANYRVPKTLKRFLVEDVSNVSSQVQRLNVKARDLYTTSPEYRKENDIDPLVKGEFLTSNIVKAEVLRKSLEISETWLNSIIQNQELLNDIYLRLVTGFSMKVVDMTIHAEGPPSYEGIGNSLYKYEFDKKYKLIYKGLGRISDLNESHYWLTNKYEYRKGVLIKETQIMCNDLQCTMGSEVQIKIYGKQGLTNITKQTYSRHDNKFIFEEKTDYYYAKGVLDSARMNYWFLGEEKPRVTRTMLFVYKSGLIQTMNDTYFSDERLKDQKSVRKYNYDSRNRLSSIDYKGWDNNNDISTLYTEEFVYNNNNAYIYRYIESFKKKRGKEVLPLQYEMIYTFN